MSAFRSQTTPNELKSCKILMAPVGRILADNLVFFSCIITISNYSKIRHLCKLHIWSFKCLLNWKKFKLWPNENVQELSHDFTSMHAVNLLFIDFCFLDQWSMASFFQSTAIKLDLNINSCQFVASFSANIASNEKHKHWPCSLGIKC